jgi:hypothetical protein
VGYTLSGHNGIPQITESIEHKKEIRKNMQTGFQKRF